MAATCTACGGPLPPHGVLSVGLSLPEGGPRRWRSCALTCSPACLARIAVQIQAARDRRPDPEALMMQRPRGR